MSEEKSRLTTLCYIKKDDSYLMMHRIKKEKDINRDKWIGIGGHFLPGESPEECLLREAREETGLTLTSYKLRGIVSFVPDNGEYEYMFLYTAEGFEGSIENPDFTDEGRLEWVKIKDVYDLNIWEGDRIFFRLLEEERDVFSLKLSYEGDRLTHAILDGTEMDITS